MSGNNLLKSVGSVTADPSSQIVGLEVGGTHVGCIVAQLGDDRIPQVIGVSEVPCNPFSNGAIRNMDELVPAIRQAVSEAEQCAGGIKIGGVYVAVGGPNIKSVTSRGKLTTQHATYEFGDDDVERAISIAKEVQIPPDREILHSVMQAFYIDGKGAIASPVGQVGRNLEAQVHLITAENVHTQNLRRACKRAGVNVEKLVFGPTATAGILVTPDQEKLGVAVVDLAHESTDWVIYHNGVLHASGSIPIGQKHITADISYGLRCPFETAESIKRQWGKALLSECSTEVRFVLQQPGANDQSVSQYLLGSIIEPRVEQLLGMLKKEWMQLKYKEKLVAGVHFYGGGVYLPGTLDLAQEILDIDVKAAKYRGEAIGHGESIGHPHCYTMLGLLNYWVHLKRQSLETPDPTPRRAVRWMIERVLEFF